MLNNYQLMALLEATKDKETGMEDPFADDNATDVTESEAEDTNTPEDNNDEAPKDDDQNTDESNKDDENNQEEKKDDSEQNKDDTNDSGDDDLIWILMAVLKILGIIPMDYQILMMTGWMILMVLSKTSTSTYWNSLSLID